MIQAWSKGHRRAAVILPTGVGKTGLYLWIIAAAVKQGKRVIVLAHRGELLDQPLRGLRKWFPAEAKSAGIVKAGRDDSSAAVIFASIQTVQSEERLNRILSHGAPDLVVCDETHHSVAPSWRRVLDRLEEAGTEARGRAPLLLGLTATPERADGIELGDFWRVAYSYPIRRAISEGYLVPPRFVVERLGEMDLSDVDPARYVGLTDEELGARLVVDGIVDHTVEKMRKHAAGLKTVIFAASVEQARLTAEALTSDGRVARYLTGKTRRTDRARLLRSLADGSVEVLVNCGVLTEGFDEPTLGAVVLARPMSSKSLYIQAVGRGLRICPDIDKRECLILDLAGASNEHSLTQAAVMLKSEERGEGGGAGAGPGEGGGELSDPLAGMFRERKKFEPEWIHVSRGLRGIDCGSHGAILAIEVHPRQWRPIFVSAEEGRTITDLASGPLAIEGNSGEFAEVTSDLARRAEKTQSQKRRGSYQMKITIRQFDGLRRYGIDPRSVDTRGEASAMISVHSAARVARSRGLI